MGSSPLAPTPIDKLEHNLIRGAARWIADLTEFFRDYRIGDTVFALYARGRTRSSGFLISRFFSWTVLPNYTVALFCLNATGGNLNLEALRKQIDLVTKTSDEEDLRWAWLVVLSTGNIQPSMVSYVSRYDKKELGLAVASTSSKQIVFSNNQIGRTIGKHLKLHKALGETAAWRP